MPPTTPNNKKRPPKKQKPNYALIHSKPLPLQVHPLPAFHPTNPISLLRFAYAYLSQLLAAPPSHPVPQYLGYFSPETRSVHVTDPVHARALWEMGFFGKGTLSRSEPSWLEREKARLMAKRAGGSGGTAEEATNARREKRRLFKLERARVEAEKIERQRLVEEGKIDSSVVVVAVLEEVEGAEVTDQEGNTENVIVEANFRSRETTIPKLAVTEVPPQLGDTGKDADENKEEEREEEKEKEKPMATFPNQEHLQLTLEEAFFLSYGLGILQIHLPTSPPSALNPPNTPALLQIFSAHSFFPPTAAAAQPLSQQQQQQPHTIRPDDPFLLNYIVYHHFRSLGWVVRPGLKFSVDYLLYYRGPVFSHAEFAIIIIPAYTHAYWATEQGRREKRVKGSGDWWWMHCVNRVQSQVLKTLVMVYVDVPAPMPMTGEGGGGEDVGALLRRYKVREFVVKRWTPNRSRD